MISDIHIYIYTYAHVHISTSTSISISISLSLSLSLSSKCIKALTFQKHLLRNDGLLRLLTHSENYSL